MTVGWPIFASPAQLPDSPLSRSLKQPLLLGLFLPIQARGWSIDLAAIDHMDL